MPQQGLLGKCLDIYGIVGSQWLWVPTLDWFPFLLVFMQKEFCFCETLYLHFRLWWDVQNSPLTWKLEIQVIKDASLGSWPILLANLAHPEFDNRVPWTSLVCDHVPLADPSDISRLAPPWSPSGWECGYHVRKRYIAKCSDGPVLDADIRSLMKNTYNQKELRHWTLGDTTMLTWPEEPGNIVDQIPATSHDLLRCIVKAAAPHLVWAHLRLLLIHPPHNLRGGTSGTCHQAISGGWSTGVS